MIGGLALFLYGMNVLSAGLEKSAGGKMEQTLKKLTSNRLKALILGAGVTALIQSSSAMTVMLVGLVNSGIMQLSQAISITMGSNVGTTITAWLLSLTGISSDNFFVNMLKPVNFSPLVALVGVILLMFGKKQKQKDAGTILAGFAVLMYGMSLMSSSVEQLAEVPEFTGILTAFSNPILGVVAGIAFTAVIQSSSASVGVLQALSMTGAITYGTAIPIVMGQNIGTCVSTLIASLGTNKNAKRVAVVHVLFNAIGTVVCLVIWMTLNGIFNFAFTDEAVAPVDIAVIHSVFNIATTVMLFPFAKPLEKLVCLIVPDAKKKEKDELFDDRLLTVPSFAVANANDATAKMASFAKKSVRTAVGLLDNFDEKTAQQVSDWETALDKYEDDLGTYLVKISRMDINESDSIQISKMLHTISDFERIGDHASNLLKAAREIHDKKIEFSKDARNEIENLTEAISEILSVTVKSFKMSDYELAETVEPLEQVIDSVTANMKSKHIARLKSGECTIEMGFVLTDIMTNCERISDHCSNVAVAVIESKTGIYDSHQYLNAVKKENAGKYAECYERYMKKYSL